MSQYNYNELRNDKQPVQNYHSMPVSPVRGNVL